MISPSFPKNTLDMDRSPPVHALRSCFHRKGAAMARAILGSRKALQVRIIPVESCLDCRNYFWMVKFQVESSSVG